jgi:hypothetical protein
MKIILLIKLSLIFLLLSGVSFLTECQNLESKSISFDDTIIISNGQIRVGVAPSVGRIVEFGYIGKLNLLWLNTKEKIAEIKKKDWVNYGGDKVWPSQQTNWAQIYGRKWPADYISEGMRWDVVEKNDRRIVIRSQTSPELAVRIQRSIEIPGEDAIVIIHNSIERLSANPFPVHILSVTQVHKPDFCLLGLWPQQPFPNRPFCQDVAEHNTPVSIKNGMAFRYECSTDKKGQVGTLGSWVAGIFSDIIFLQTTDASLDACYPDRASVWAYTCHDYVELETISESRHIKPGEQLLNTVTWRLLKRNLDDSEDNIAEIATKLSRQKELKK